MYRCQSAHKLVEIDVRFSLFAKFRPRTVVDLAAAPGGFAQVALEQMHKYDASRNQTPMPSPLVIAVDQRPIEPLVGLVTVRGNILQHQQILQTVQRTLDVHPSAAVRVPTDHRTRRSVDMVLHDGVSVVKGQHQFSVTYAQNPMALSTLLLPCKLFVQLGPEGGNGRRSDHNLSAGTGSAKHGVGGASPSVQATSNVVPVCFVSKVLRCPHFGQVVAATNALFRNVAVFKPEASRVESQETYVVATDFLPGRWSRLVKSSPEKKMKSRSRSRDAGKPSGKSKRAAVEISPALFSLPPAVQDCSDTRHMVWTCLGCGRTCMDARPCSQCGPFAPSEK